MDSKELAAALRLQLKLDPPVTGGVPKLLLDLFIRFTAAWLAQEDPPLKELPLRSHKSLRAAIAEHESKGRLRPNRRSKKSNPTDNQGSETARQEIARQRAEQISETLTAALTSLSQRLRRHPSAQPKGDDTVFLAFEVALGQERFTVELTGLLPKNRAGLGFPEDERVGFLGRLVKLHAPPTSSRSRDGSARSEDASPQRDPTTKNVEPVSTVPLVRKKFTRSAILRGMVWIAVVVAGWLVARPDISTAPPLSLPPITTHLQSFSDVRFSYATEQSTAISPVCGCQNELDARLWRGISYFGRRAVIERLSGSAATKFLITAASPVRIRSTPYAYNIEGVVYHLTVPFGEAFDSSTLLNDAVPKSYRVQARETFQGPQIILTAVGPVRIDAYGPVPFGAWLPVEGSEVSASTSRGMALTSRTNVVITERYKRWHAGSGHYPIADFVGADTVIWTEPTRHVASSPQRRDIVAVRVTNPGFATRLAITPHAATDDDGNVTLHPPPTGGVAAVDRDGLLRFTIEDVDENLSEFGEVIDRLKQNDLVWIPRIRQLAGSLFYQDKSGMFHLADPDPPFPPRRMRLEEDVDATVKFRYPPVPPRNGINIFGQLRSLVFSNAIGSIARGTREYSFVVPASFSFHDIAQFAAAGGVITLPLVSDGSSTTIRLDGSATVEVNGQPLFVERHRWASLRQIATGVALCAFATLLVSGEVMLGALRRRRKDR
jgi:hypothetical protein